MSRIITRSLFAKQKLAQLQSIEEFHSDTEREKDDDFSDNEIDVQSDDEEIIDESGDSESEEDNDDDNSENDDDLELISKNGTKWSKLNENDVTKIRHRIYFNEKVGPTYYSERNIDSTAMSAFLIFFDSTISKIITTFTNKEASFRGDTFRISQLDLLCFVAVLYCRGTFCSKMSTKSLWSKNYGLPLIKDLCSRNKFLKIMKYLRFDDKNKRRESIHKDKFLMIRQVW